jgi:hypothetical protein
MAPSVTMAKNGTNGDASNGAPRQPIKNRNLSSMGPLNGDLTARITIKG